MIKEINKVLIQYKRRKNGHPMGVVVAIDANKIGWSMCHKDDKWDREKALHIATSRAISSTSLTKVPHTMRELVNKMTEKSKIYFK